MEYLDNGMKGSVEVPGDPRHQEVKGIGFAGLSLNSIPVVDPICPFFLHT